MGNGNRLGKARQHLDRYRAARYREFNRICGERWVDRMPARHRRVEGAR